MSLGDAIVKVERKLAAFQKLPAGWHYGEGCPVAEATAMRATKLIGFLRGRSFDDFDVFPSEFGDLELVGYKGNERLAIIIRADGCYDLVREDVRSTMSSYVDDLNFERLMVELCLSLDLSTQASSILTLVDPQSSPLPNLLVAEEYQWSSYPAPITHPVGFVSMSSNSTRPEYREIQQLFTFSTSSRYLSIAA